MGSSRAHRRGRGVWLGVCLGAACVAAPGLAAASAVDLYYERAVMSEAGRRCGLFTAPVASALAAGQAQARGAALRAGHEAGELAGVETRAYGKARSVPCDSKDISLAAGRVRAAFEGYSRLLKMAYPGDIAGWNAERIASRTSAVWTLAQTTSMAGGQMTFGLASRDGRSALTAVVQFPDAAQPYAARLVIRDVTRAPRPYLDTRKAQGGVLPLSARIAPRSVTRAFLAEARAVPDPLIAPKSGKGAIAFRFSSEAAKALAALDPRDAVEVEFLVAGPSGDQVRKAYVEVGDFAAGMAFLSVAQR